MSGSYLYFEPDAQASAPCIICSLCGDEIYGLDRIYIFQGEPICGQCMYFYAQEGLRPLYAKDYKETGGYGYDDEAIVGRVP